MDDDGDGLMDCEDGDCALHEACTELVCDDGLDSDDDGLVDCADDDCWGGPCHPAGVRSRVTGGGAFERSFLIVESERGFARDAAAWFEATGIQGQVQVLPAGVTSWGATAARTTCSWSLDSVTARFISMQFSDPGSSHCSSGYRVSPAMRSGLTVTPGCRLYSSWFLPEKLIVPQSGADVWADYWFAPCSLSGVATLWYPLVSSTGWSTHIRSTTTRGTASTVFQEYWAGTTHAVIGSGGSSFLQLP